MGLACAGVARPPVARGAAPALPCSAVTMLLALPTVAIDAFNTQDIVPNGLGPAWRRTEVITPPEMEGLQWLRAHTDARAVVQVDTLARGDEMWAYIPAFAERRMAVGMPLSMVPLRKYQEGADRVQWIYDAPDPRVAFTLAERFGIDYLVVGPPERTAHPGVETAVGGRPRRVADGVPQRRALDLSGAASPALTGGPRLRDPREVCKASRVGAATAPGPADCRPGPSAR